MQDRSGRNDSYRLRGYGLTVISELLAYTLFLKKKNHVRIHRKHICFCFIEYLLLDIFDNIVSCI